jgi:hypothetical protein
VYPRLIRAAAAQVGDRLLDLVLTGVGVALEQGGGGDGDARGAEPALDRLLGDQRLLDGVRAIARQALDGGDEPPFGLGHGDQATAQRGPIDKDHARTAIASAAAVLGAGEVCGIAQRPEQRGLRVDLETDGSAVDCQVGHVPGA